LYSLEAKEKNRRGEKMKNKKLALALVAGALVVSAQPLWAAEQERTKEKIQTQTKDQERIYGSELMTQKERNEYRDRMRRAKTDQEREKIRNQHHEQMLARAKERGVKIPDEPPAKGGGMGPVGGGMGPGGGGKGSGPRR
jgi:Na+-translocating ferredoxin:NAD+ oxidoreductase RnfG subunit